MLVLCAGTADAVGEGVAAVHAATPIPSASQSTPAVARASASHHTNTPVWTRIISAMCFVGSQNLPVEPPSSREESV